MASASTYNEVIVFLMLDYQTIFFVVFSRFIACLSQFVAVRKIRMIGTNSYLNRFKFGTFIEQKASNLKEGILLSTPKPPLGDPFPVTDTILVLSYIDTLQRQHTLNSGQFIEPFSVLMREFLSRIKNVK